VRQGGGVAGDDAAAYTSRHRNPSPEAPRRVIDHAVERFGPVDVLIGNHAMSAPGRLTEVSGADLDLAWAVNARASVLLVQAYANHHDDSRPDGRVLLFTSGQHRGPMARRAAICDQPGSRAPDDRVAGRLPGRQVDHR
jgi:NAD(P)-dependent dehydrogenase (short-subunit alcohol dehydrogenase family)